MTILRWVWLVCLLGYGCGARPEAPPPLFRGAALLAAVPADTPYLVASLGAVSEVQLRAQSRPVRDSLLVFKVLAETGPVWRLLADVTHSASTQPTGFDLRSPYVLYGIDTYPVLRIASHDPVLTGSWLDRLAVDLGTRLRDGQAGDRAFRQVVLDDVSVLAAVVGASLTVAIVPTSEVERLAPRLLSGQVEGSLDPARIAAWASAHESGLSYFGWLHLDQLVAEGTPLATYLGEVAPHPSCLAELRAGVSLAPRATLSTQPIGDHTWRTRLEVELAPETHTALQRVLRPAPALSPVYTGADRASLSVGADLFQTILGARVWARHIWLQPRACAWFEPVNTLARRLLADRAVSFPPIDGVALALTRLAVKPEPDPRTLEGAAWVRGDLDVAAWLPWVTQLVEAPVGRPVSVALPPPAGLLLPPARGIRVEGGFGLGLGESGAQRLEAFRRASVLPDAPWAVLHVDDPFIEMFLAELAHQRGEVPRPRNPNWRVQSVLAWLRPGRLRIEHRGVLKAANHD